MNSALKCQFNVKIGNSGISDYHDFILIDNIISSLISSFFIIMLNYICISIGITC